MYASDYKNYRHDLVNKLRDISNLLEQAHLIALELGTNQQFTAALTLAQSNECLVSTPSGLIQSLRTAYINASNLRKDIDWATTKLD
jgi:hypothetical protein